MIVRDAGEADIPASRAIYAEHVRHGLGTFELEPPDAEKMAARRRAVLALGLPYLVAELDGEVLGYCYGGAYRPRPAYRHTVEDSVYVASDAMGRGVGSALLAELIRRCEAGAWRQMLAVIGDSGNASSIALHRRFGFREIGRLEAVGYKFDRWVDVVIMQRALGAGAATPPRSAAAS